MKEKINFKEHPIGTVFMDWLYVFVKINEEMVLIVNDVLCETNDLSGEEVNQGIMMLKGISLVPEEIQNRYEVE